MNFIDLHDNFPSIVGIYDVVVKCVDKGERHSKAFWNGLGFSLIGTEYVDSEYICKWSNNDIIIRSKLL